MTSVTAAAKVSHVTDTNLTGNGRQESPNTDDLDLFVGDATPPLSESEPHHEAPPIDGEDEAGAVTPGRATTPIRAASAASEPPQDIVKREPSSEIQELTSAEFGRKNGRAPDTDGDKPPRKKKKSHRLPDDERVRKVCAYYIPLCPQPEPVQY